MIVPLHFHLFKRVNKHRTVERSFDWHIYYDSVQFSIHHSWSTDWKMYLSKIYLSLSALLCCVHCCAMAIRKKNLRCVIELYCFVFVLLLLFLELKIEKCVRLFTNHWPKWQVIPFLLITRSCYITLLTNHSQIYSRTRSQIRTVFDDVREFFFVFVGNSRLIVFTPNVCLFLARLCVRAYACACSFLYLFKHWTWTDHYYLSANLHTILFFHPTQHSHISF